MGWTGTYMRKRPKGKERIEAAIRQEGYYDIGRGRFLNVLDSALVSSTVYLAVHHEDKRKGIDSVQGVVILTQYKDHEFATKSMSEETGPYNCDCPKRILKLLTPTDSENALQWRRACDQRREEKYRKNS